MVDAKEKPGDKERNASKHGCQNAIIYELKIYPTTHATDHTSCGGKAGTVTAQLFSEASSTAGMDLQGRAAIGRKIRPDINSCHLDPTPLHSHAAPSRACTDCRLLFYSKDWLPRPLGQPPLQDSAPRPACQALGSHMERLWESSLSDIGLG